MRGMEKQKQQKIPTSILLSLLLLSLVLLTVQMLSRYVTGGEGGSSSRVAKFQVTSDLQGFQKVFSVELSPGKTQKYTFKIENGSETALNLQMNLHCKGNIPFKLTYCENVLESGNNVVNQSTSEHILADNIVDAESDPYWNAQMNPGEKEKSYTLILSWPNDRNEMTYAGGVSTVELKIRAEQAD